MGHVPEPFCKVFSGSIGLELCTDTMDRIAAAWPQQLVYCARRPLITAPLAHGLHGNCWDLGVAGGVWVRVRK